MKNFPARRPSRLLSIFVYAIFGFFATYCSAQVHANANTTGNNSGGVGRGDNGQTLRVIVKLGDKLMPNVLVQIKVADGSIVLSKRTAKNGSVSIPLDAGNFTVAATSTQGTATSPVTIIQSTDPALLTLTLTSAP